MYSPVKGASSGNITGKKPSLSPWMLPREGTAAWEPGWRKSAFKERKLFLKGHRLQTVEMNEGVHRM